MVHVMGVSRIRGEVKTFRSFVHFDEARTRGVMRLINGRHVLVVLALREFVAHVARAPRLERHAGGEQLQVLRALGWVITESAWVGDFGRIGRVAASGFQLPPGCVRIEVRSHLQRMLLLLFQGAGLLLTAARLACPHHPGIHLFSPFLCMPRLIIV